MKFNFVNINDAHERLIENFQEYNYLMK